MLLASQKLAIIDSARENGFPKSKIIFDIKVDDQNFHSIKIEVKDTPYYFYINEEYIFEHTFNCTYSPAEHELVAVSYAENLTVAVKKVQNWFNNCSKELEAENELNKLLEISQDLFSSDEENESSNLRFTAPEITEISKRFKDLEEHLTKFDLLPEELKKITATLEVVKAKTKTLGKIDWRNAFVGAILGNLTSLALNPEVAKEILSAISTIIFVGQGFLPLVK